MKLPAKVRDLRGSRFGRLLVKSFERLDREVARESGHALWRCQCDCGERPLVRGTRLTQGRQVSCGCYRADPEIRRAARLQIPPAERRRLAGLKH